MMNSPYITLAVIISLQSAHAAAIIARATTPVTRSRGRRFARGLIAAIVIPSRKLNSRNIFKSSPHAFVFFFSHWPVSPHLMLLLPQSSLKASSQRPRNHRSDVSLRARLCTPHAVEWHESLRSAWRRWRWIWTCEFTFFRVTCHSLNLECSTHRKRISP